MLYIPGTGLSCLVESDACARFYREGKYSECNICHKLLFQHPMCMLYKAAIDTRSYYFIHVKCNGDHVKL